MLEKYLVKKYEFRYNTIKNRVESRLRSAPEAPFKQVNDLLVWREVNYNLGRYGHEYVCKAIGSVGFTNEYNPLTTWLESLKLDELAKKLPYPIGNFDPFEQLISFVDLSSKLSEEADLREKKRFYTAVVKWFVSAVRCLYEPFFAPKQALVFMGKQSIGKTPFAKSILTPFLNEFIKTNPNLNPSNKDARIALSQNFLVLFDEIDDYFKCRDNRDNYKSVMTETYVNERLPYAKTPVVRKRICSFVGTCNEAQFLNDPTGTDRWVVFEVDGFHYNVPEGVFGWRDFDMDVCWAYAYKLYKSGFDTDYSEEELLLNETVNDKYKFNTPEYETLLEFLEPADKGHGEFMTSTQICSYLNGRQSVVSFNPVRLGKALVRAGFRRFKGEGIYGYYVRKLDIVNPTLKPR